MKHNIYNPKLGLLALFFSVASFSQHLTAQSVGKGKIEARFGVDGDLSADTALNGGAIAPNPNMKHHASVYYIQQWNGSDFQTLATVPAMGSVQSASYEVAVQPLPSNIRIFRVVLRNENGSLDIGPSCQSALPMYEVEQCRMYPNPVENTLGVMLPQSESVKV